MSSALRRPWLTVAAAVAVVVLIAVAWTMMRSSTTRTPAGAPQTSSASPSEILVLPPQTADELRTIVDKFNAMNADSPPTSVQVVATSSAEALNALQPGASSDQPVTDVYLIIETGQFTLRGASVPAGAELPSGPKVHITVDAKTMYVISWGQAIESFEPLSLGPVADLT